jgi:hypothetical protein
MAALGCLMFAILVWKWTPCDYMSATNVTTSESYIDVLAHVQGERNLRHDAADFSQVDGADEPVVLETTWPSTTCSPTWVRSSVWAPRARPSNYAFRRCAWTRSKSRRQASA